MQSKFTKINECRRTSELLHQNNVQLFYKYVNLYLVKNGWISIHELPFEF